MQSLHALVLEDGTLVEKSMQAADKLPPLAEQSWPRAFPVVRQVNRPTKFHSPAGQMESLVGDQWTIVPLWTAPADLDAVKADLRLQVDTRAKSIRLQFITPGAGQALVYQRKAQEARDYLAAQSPQPEDYPVLSASVGIEGDTLSDIAQMVVAKENLWAGIAAVIEAKRLAGKAAIDAAEDAVAACAAFDAIDWTLPQ